MKNAIIDEILNSKTANNLETLSEEYSLLLKKAVELLNKLKEKLSPELFSLVSEYSDALGICNCEEADRYFAQGFSCALRICFECFK